MARQAALRPCIFQLQACSCQRLAVSQKSSAAPVLGSGTVL